MISRLRTDAEGRLFEVFLELAHPESDTESAYILQKYPEQYSDEEVMKPIPKFTFPYSSYRSSSRVEHFTFVLTDLESKFRFGFCRLTPGNHTCLCFISCLPWYEIFYGLLDRLSDILNSTQPQSIVPLLQRLHSVTTLGPGETISVATLDANLKYSFICPIQNQLPSIPENRNLTELFNLLDINSLMIVFASLINERRVLIVSERLSRLTACVHASALLLYPMSWQHLYIPVLPSHLLDYCSAPMPYLIGIHSSIMKKLKMLELGDAVVLDVDSNRVSTEHNDLAELPVEVVGMLKRLLKQAYVAGTSGRIIGDSVSRSFLKTLVALIGGYRDALKFRAGEQITFDPEAFVQSRPASVQPFLQRFLQMQVFQQFVADRLDMLNSGEGFSDEFELEASMCADKWGAQSRYKSWLTDMKVHGRKFQREGKDKLSELANRMREKGKKSTTEHRAKRDDVRKVGGVTESKFYDRPGSERLDHSRPPRPPPPNRSLRANGSGNGRGLGKDLEINVGLRPALDKTQHYRLFSPDDENCTDGATGTRRVSIDDSALLDSFQRPFVNTDLLSDPDIQSMFQKSYSLEEINAAGERESTPHSDGTAGRGEERMAPLCDFEDDEVEGESEGEDSSGRRAGNTDRDFNGGIVTLGRAWVRFTSDSSEPPLDDDSLSVEPRLALDALSISSLSSRSSELPQHVDSFTAVSTSAATAAATAGTAAAAAALFSHSTISCTSSPNVDPITTRSSTPSTLTVLGIPTPTPRDTILLRRALSHQGSVSRPSQQVRDKPLIDLDSFQSDDLELDPLKCRTTEREINESADHPTTTASVVAVACPPVQPRLSKISPPTTSAQSRGNTASAVLSDLNRNHTTRGSGTARARAAFIEAEAPKPVLIHQNRLGSLDQFDPLATGQLAVDSYESSSSRNSPSSSLRSNVEEEENLLKGWNLDVRYRGIPNRDVAAVRNPGCVVKPSSAALLAAQLQPAASMQPFSSMPNLSGPVYTLPPGLGLAMPHGNITVLPMPYQNVHMGFVTARPMVALTNSATSAPLGGNFPVGNSSVGIFRNEVKSATLPVNSSLSMDPFTENLLPTCMSPVNHSTKTFETNGNNSTVLLPSSSSSAGGGAKRWEKFD